MTSTAWQVLIADDEANDRALIRRALQTGAPGRVYRFVEATTAAEALRLATAEAGHQVVVLDFALPDGTALDVLAGLPREPGNGRAGQVLLHTPVVVVTGRDEASLGAQLLRAGASEFVGKDWLTPASLTRALENAVERHALARELSARRAALHESETRSRTVFEFAATGIVIADQAGRVLRANAAFCTLAGRSEAALRACPFASLVHPDDLPLVSSQLRRLQAGEVHAASVEGRYLRPDGSAVWTQTVLSLLGGAEGRRAEVIALVTDIDARKRAEAELASREAAARLVAETAARLVLGNVAGSTSDLVFSSVFGEVASRLGADLYLHYAILAEPGTLQLVSCRGLDLAAYPHLTRIAVGEHPCGLAAASGAPVVLGPLAPGESPAGMPSMRAFAGYPVAVGDRVFGMLAFASRERERFTGEELALIGTLADLVAAWMDRARLTAALRERETRLSLFIEHAPAALAMFDRDMRYLAASRRWLADYGLEDRDLTGRSHYEVFPEIPAAWREVHRRALAGEVLSSDGEAFVRADGRVQWERWEVRPWLDVEGRIGGIIIATEDITAERATEAALRASGARARALANAMPQLVWTADDTGKVDYFSERAIEYQGLEPGPGGRPRWRRILHPDDLRPTLRAWRAAVASGGGYSFEHRLRMADGGFRWHLSRAVPMVDPATGARTWYGTATDIHELREAQELARRRLDELSATYDTAPVGLCVLDRELRYVRINQRLAELNGLSVEEHLGRRVGEVVPQLGAVAQALARRVLAGETILDYEIRGQTRADPGVEHIWVESWHPLRDAAGEVVGINIVAEDVTAQRRAQEELRLHREELERLVRERTAELEASHGRLRLSERMAALGTLAAGLGHDMGNLLMPVRVRLDALQARPLPEPVQRELEAIRAAAGYLQRLASGLRLLAIDPEHGTAEHPTEVGQWWREAEPVLRNILPRGTELEVNLPEGPLWVRMAAPALTQVVFNLVQNAGDVLQGRPRARVGVTVGEEGEEVMVQVTDNGPGMSDEVQRRCLEPFFTTKTRGLSTGLGLALVHGLVREAGGRIELHSAPAAGTTFTLVLPRADEPEASGQGERRVYVSIHDPRVRAYATAQLQSRACHVGFEPAAAEQADLLVVEGAPPAGSHGHVVALGPQPTIGEVKAALRTALDEAPSRPPAP